MPRTLDRDHCLHDYEPGSTERTLPRASLTNREPIQQQHLLLSKEHRKGTSITNIRVTSITTGALASAVLGLAGNANAAPPARCRSTPRSASCARRALRSS